MLPDDIGDSYEYGQGYEVGPQDRRFGKGRRQRSGGEQPTPWQALLDPGELPRFEAAARARTDLEGISAQTDAE